ncbi:hypothetical protein DRP53_02455 [candidate division WOR-3 bacterium]|uniref:Uncharacterized protein n=1 Tax=candidate division WOR-3 bacterium TaxID=2052148 RepID=A0A660SK32_UNCW3|nr:MAG: hypothetical protein DRP53_02455 [candidate division WOR-3 bacterium]
MCFVSFSITLLEIFQDQTEIATITYNTITSVNSVFLGVGVATAIAIIFKFTFGEVIIGRDLRVGLIWDIEYLSEITSERIYWPLKDRQYIL